MFFETKQQSKRKKKVHFLLIRKMLLHVLLKTRIHFYLCKFLYLQFGHESSAPISFKYAFTMARRLVRLTQPCYLGGSLPVDSSQLPAAGERPRWVLGSLCWRRWRLCVPRRGLQPSLAKPRSLLNVERPRRLPGPRRWRCRVGRGSAARGRADTGGRAGLAGADLQPRRPHSCRETPGEQPCKVPKWAVQHLVIRFANPRPKISLISINNNLFALSGTNLKICFKFWLGT